MPEREVEFYLCPEKYKRFLYNVKINGLNKMFRKFKMRIKCNILELTLYSYILCIMKLGVRFRLLIAISDGTQFHNFHTLKIYCRKIFSGFGLKYYKLCK